jgi:hypothetical protein
MLQRGAAPSATLSWWQETGPLPPTGHDYVFEPDWSQIVGRPINTRTDYLVQIDGSSIACEVKGFAPSDKRDRIWDWSKGSFWVGPDDELEPIRRQLKEGAKNLKPLAGAGMPLVIVLADPPRSDPQRTNVAVDSFNLVGAMYGNPAVKASLDPDVPISQIVTRNGEMARQHQHVSAVVTLSGIAPNAPVFADVYDSPGVDAITLPDSVFRRGVRTRHGFLHDDAYGLRFYGGAFD